MVGACTAVLLLPGMPRLEAQALPSNDAPPVVKENASAIPSALDNMIPIGETYLGVKVPSYQGDRKSSVMEARSMRRVDTEHLDIAGLVVRVYDLETGEMTTIDPTLIAPRAVLEKLASSTIPADEKENLLLRWQQRVFDFRED